MAEEGELIIVKHVMIILALAVAGCDRVGTSNESASKPANEAVEISTDVLSAYPRKQPDGRPLTAAYCSKVGNDVGNPFDNVKTCLMVACEAGDKASCEGAATFNGNMWPDGEEPSRKGQRLIGRFEAQSTTAMGVTGDLTVAPASFQFELDQAYMVGAPLPISASSAVSRHGDTWADLMIIPTDGTVMLWPVTGQTIGKRGRRQSRCGQGGKVGYIATADREDGLGLVAFSGEKPPGPGMDDTALCGTYFYARAKK